jgi:NitT/TauT family transport system substrate-binding protein
VSGHQERRSAGSTALVGAFSVLLLAACGGGEKTPAEGTDALSEDSVVVASVSPSWLVVAPVLVAEENGYWEEEGLSVKREVVGPGTAHIGALIGGSIDFSVNINTPTLIQAASKGADLVAIASSQDTLSYVLYAKGVDSVEDLAGKTIVTDAPGGDSEFFTLDVLAEHGLSADDVSLQPIGGTLEAREQAVVTGVADAAIGSLLDQGDMEANGVVTLAKLSDLYPEYVQSVTGARGEFVDEHPDTTAAFLKGMIRAWQFIQDEANTDAVLDLLDANDVPRPEDGPAALELLRQVQTSDGSIPAAALEAVFERGVSSGMVPKDYALDTFTKLEPLEVAQQEIEASPEGD